jgi:outer membrane protein OmpA-like peptidoglycan-associated protein
VLGEEWGLFMARFMFAALAVVLGLFAGTLARAAGVSGDNLVPGLDNHSGLMWETARTNPGGSLLWSYTFSYLLRPIEFGDGDDTRLAVADHMQVNHLGLSWGLFDSVQVGASFPIALYTAPDTQDYLVSADGDGRKFLYLGDPFLRAKWSLFPKRREGFGLGVLAEVGLPLGAPEAFMSDDAFRVQGHALMHYALDGGWEPFFNVGVGFWSNPDRVVAQDAVTGDRRVLVSKSEALFVQTGLRWWVVGYTRRAGSIQAEAGVRGEFAGFELGLQERASPIEWSAGGLFFLSNRLSLHGAYGTGIGSGVTAPLSRLLVGLRYIDGARPTFDESQGVASGATSESYTDEELDLIFEEAQAERQPQLRPSLETMLRLKTQFGVLDIGAINFEFDSAKLTSKARETVRRLYDELVKISPRSIKIDGHTDSVGSYEYNLALSKRRANSVRDELVRLGIASNIVRTEGFSFKYPMTSNATPAGRAANRRIEVSVDGLSFRKSEYSREEIEVFRRWIYPGGRAVEINTNRPDLAQ